MGNITYTYDTKASHKRVINTYVITYLKIKKSFEFVCEKNPKPVIFFGVVP